MNRSWDIAPLRLITAVSLMFLVAGTGLSALLLDHEVNFTLVSMRERGIWAAILMAVALGFFLAVLWYERRVVMKLRLSVDGRHLKLTTPTIFGESHHVINCSDVTDLHIHGGDNAAEETWTPPWLLMDVRGKQSFVVPLSGIEIERDRLVQFLRSCSRRPAPIFETLGHRVEVAGPAADRAPA